MSGNQDFDGIEGLNPLRNLEVGIKMICHYCPHEVVSIDVVNRFGS